MITITNARTQRGWSPTDHLIDDSRLAEVIGVSYASVEHARRAVASRCDSRGYGMFEYVCHAGSRHYRYDDSPGNIPGRTVQRIREVHA